MTQQERIIINRAAVERRTVYIGRTRDRTQYLVDNRDCLPPDILAGSFDERLLDCTGTALVAAVETTEREGWNVCLQIGNAFYETT